MSIRIVIAGTILSLLALGSLCYARPPKGITVDPGTAEWYGGLQTPDGLPCCSVSDCRPVQARQTEGHWEVFIDRKSFNLPRAEGTDRWEPVPQDAILDHKPNPTGSAVACWYFGSVRCFVRPAGA